MGSGPRVEGVIYSVQLPSRNLIRQSVFELNDKPIERRLPIMDRHSLFFDASLITKYKSQAKRLQIDVTKSQ